MSSKKSCKIWRGLSPLIFSINHLRRLDQQEARWPGDSIVASIIRQTQRRFYSLDKSNWAGDSEVWQAILEAAPAL